MEPVMAEATVTAGARWGDTEDGRWRRWAACRKVPTAVFFPAGNFARWDEKQAKTVCATCPVQADCLAFALENDEAFGVWGGLNERERRALAGGEQESCRPAASASVPT
jgi:WhiB family transcriptional regulator, redox-sensing transcriptional regulator